MPRFLPFASPGRDEAPLLSSPSNSASVRLSCLNPDGRSVHSLDMAQHGQAFIETHRLPLDGTTLDEDEFSISKIRIRLPDHVATALDRYPALELICVDVDNSSSSDHTIKLPTLCLYTKRDVFLLELAYDNIENVKQVEGLCLSVTEPFEQLMMGTSLATEIIRIRPAPQRFMGHVAAMCPPTSMAMLTYCRETSLTSLHLYHGNNELTCPLTFGMEQLDDPSEQFTDFCFLQCQKSFQLLSNLTVALVKGSGDVHIAGPILFRGTVVPKQSVTETLEYMELMLSNKPSDSPQWRQIKVAKQYLIDAFPMRGDNAFVTAQALSEAFGWPVKLQGALLESAESDDFETLATSIQPFAGSDDLIGLAVGHVGGIVEFGLLSPMSLIPRFEWELGLDGQELDASLNEGAIVTRVDLRDEEGHGGSLAVSNGSLLTLIPDPIMDAVLHVVTPTQVQSISTNTLKVLATKLRQQVSSPGMLSPSRPKNSTPKTTAWSCLDVSSLEEEHNSVVGAVVSGDVQLGHVLVCRLSNGSMVAVNLTETRQLQEMEALAESDATSSSVDNTRLKEVQDILPLHEIVEPLTKKIIKGLDGLSKVVGSSTSLSKVTPDQLAAATAIKQHCDEEIVVPIAEMNLQIKTRKKVLAVMYANQMQQLKTLQDTVAKLKERTSIIQEKAEVVSSNSTSLAQRSAGILQSSKDLFPKITQAEYDYLQHLKKLDVKTQQWMGNFENLQDEVCDVEQAVINDSFGELELSGQMKHSAQTLFNRLDELEIQYKQRLEIAEEKVDDLAAAAGVECDSEY